MSPNLEFARELLKDPRYPRTWKYDPEWQVGFEMGCPEKIVHQCIACRCALKGRNAARQRGQMLFRLGKEDLDQFCFVNSRHLSAP